MSTDMCNASGEFANGMPGFEKNLPNYNPRDRFLASYML